MVAVRQNVTVPFAQGLDLKSDEFQLPAGKLSILENAAFDKLGAISKRTGHDPVVSGSPLAAGVGIGHYRGQTLVSDGKRLYRVNGSALKHIGGGWAAFRLSQTPVASAGRVLNASTSASASYVCTAIESPSGVRVVVQDASGGHVTTYDFPGTSRPQMVYFSGLSKHVLVTRDPALTGLRVYALDPANQSHQTLYVEQNTRGQFSVWADANFVYVAAGRYHAVFLVRFNVVGGQLYQSDICFETSSVMDFPAAVTGCQISNGRSAVFWLESNKTIYGCLFYAGSVLQTEELLSTYGLFSSVHNLGVVFDGFVCHLLVDSSFMGTWTLGHDVVRADYKAIASSTVAARGVSLAARPFMSGDRIIAPVISRAESQRRYMLLDVLNPQVLARFDDETLDVPGQGCIGLIHSVGTKAYLPQALAANSGATVSVGVADTELGAFYGHELANSFYFLLGSRLHRYDGDRVTEDGFDLYPDRAQFPAATGSAHTYQYRVVWSWTDALGLTHWSTPSPNVTYKTANPIGAGAAVSPINIPVYLLPTLKGDIKIHLFRTEDNGTEFHEVLTRLSSEATGGIASISVSDDVSDAQLVGSDVFGALLPDPAACSMAVQQRGIVPPAICEVHAVSGGGLEAYTPYFYVLTALTPNGETVASGEVGRLPYLTYPSTRSLLVSWSHHSSASGYRLYRSSTQGSGYRLLKELAAGATSFLDDGSLVLTDQSVPSANTTASGKFTGATPLAVPVISACGRSGAGSLSGQPRYRVTVINARGETMASLERGGPADYGEVPLSNERVSLSWGTVSGAIAYNVYRGEDVGLEGHIATVSAPTTSYIDDGSITKGSACPTSDTSADGGDTASTQYYRVSALNETGETLASTEASIVLRSSDTPCGVLVSWARIPGAARYRVYGRATGAEQLLFETLETSWIDTNTETPSGALPTSNTTGPRPYSGGPALYTAGGVVPNLPASPTGFLVEHQKRLWGIDSANPLRLWYTHKAAYGFPLEGNPLLLTLDLPATGGDCIGLASLDDKLLIFKRQCVLWTNGSGPDPTGAGEFAEPVLLTADVGLQDPKSIVMTPAGIMFRSQKGIYLIDRALGCSYLGAPAEDLWLSTDTVRSAVLCALDNEVRWYLPGVSGAGSARAIVYHYLVGQWSLHKISAFGAADAHVNPLTGLVEIIGPTGQVMRANRSSYADPGFYALKVRTGWLALGQLNGYGRMHRLQLLAHWLSAHNLAVTIEFDKEGASQTVTIPALTTMTPERWQVNPRTHRCESVRVTIQDADGAGASCSLSALTFEVSLKPGMKRLGSAKKFAAT